MSSFIICSIGCKAFHGCNVEGLTQIGKQAFSSCCHNHSIHLLPSLMVLGDDAFEDCTSLSHVSFHRQVPRGSRNIDSTISHGCHILRKIEFGKDINSIIKSLSLSMLWNNGIQSINNLDKGVNLVRSQSCSQNACLSSDHHWIRGPQV